MLSNEPYEISYDDIRSMWEQNLAALEECEHVTESTRKGESYYDGKGDVFMKMARECLYRDAKTNGHLMRYPHGTIIRQGQTYDYYRGESQIYASTQPTIYRRLERLSEDERTVYRFVSRMRIAEFELFLRRFTVVSDWEVSGQTVLYDALAQHYGLETEWLDITSDFNIALFFATCKWDASTKTWRPLTRDDTECSVETQYGVIFHMPSWQADSREGLLLTPDPFNHNVILPIGYQPFMRCHSQHAYGIKMEDQSHPLQDDIGFEKLRFRHNERLSKDVFEMMEEGRLVYPSEGLNEFDDVIALISKTTTFSNKAFRMVLDNTDVFNTETLALEALQSIGVDGQPITILTGDDRPDFHLSRQRIRAFNRKCEGMTLEDLCGIDRIYYRPCYRR